MRQLSDIISDIDNIQNANIVTNELVDINLDELKTSMGVIDQFFGKNVKLEDVAFLYSEIIKNNLANLLKLKNLSMTTFQR